MTKLNILKALQGKWEDGTRPKDLFERHISRDPESYLNDLVAGLACKQLRVQNGCAELSSLLSQVKPVLLEPYLDLFISNLDAKEAVLRWEAACTLGNLATISKSPRLIDAIDNMIELLDHESIVLQGHVVRALAKIAQAFPERAQQIFGALVRAESFFPGSRVGYLLEAMGSFALFPALAPKASKFAQRHRNSDLRPVAAKANRALRDIAKGLAKR